MALKIRLRQQGATNRVMYRLVVADSRSPRDGKYIEALGWYNPHAPKEDAEIFVKPDRLQHWLQNGAQISESAQSLLERAAPEVVKTYFEGLRARKIKRKQKEKKSRVKAVKAVKAKKA